jgi:hypothetical protein
MIKCARMWQRAYRLITQPDKTWREIKGESPEIRRLFVSYALPLMLLPLFSSIVRVVMARSAFITFSFVTSLLLGALANYLLSAAALLLAGWLVSVLAQYFSSKTDLAPAMKLVVYSLTPVWLAALFNLVPRLAVLSSLGLYAAFLIYAGLPVMLETPPEKHTAFAASVIALGVFILMYLSITAGGLFYL